MSGIDHCAEDMTATVSGGVSLAALQSELSRQGQWLPVDPPHAERLTVKDLLDGDPSGPRRYGFGTIRDHLIGISVKLADGRLVHSGGKVVKNVAGYDLAKLFIGAGGSLGSVVDATFKLRPLPGEERFLSVSCASLEEADRQIEVMLKSPITPVVLDLHQLTEVSSLTLVLGFAGSCEEVAWQADLARELGFGTAADLRYDSDFRMPGAKLIKLSVLPSLIITTLSRLEGIPFVARAGNGIIYSMGGASLKTEESLPLELMRRLKRTFDPGNLLPQVELLSEKEASR